MSTEEQASAHLIANPSFNRLTLAEASEFLQGGRTRSFGAGQVLLREGEQGDSLMVVTEGQVSVHTGGFKLAELGPGATLGEMSLVDPGARSATVLALSPGKVIEIGRKTFEENLAAGNPTTIKALQGMTDTVFGRLVSVSQQVRDEMTIPRGNVFARLWQGVRSKSRKP